MELLWSVFGWVRQCDGTRRWSPSMCNEQDDQEATTAITLVFYIDLYLNPLMLLTELHPRGMAIEVVKWNALHCVCRYTSPLCRPSSS